MNALIYMQFAVKSATKPLALALYFLLLFSLSQSNAIAQRLGVYNAEHKLVYKYKAGSSIDFRIDYNKLYPDRTDSILESRVFGFIDSISGNEIRLIENQVILHFTRTNEVLVEEPYEYTDLTVNALDIKALSFTTTGQSIGTALIAIGAAALIISPLFGLNPEGYSGERVAIVAGMGLGSAVIGTGLYFSFGQKPVKIKPFNGPDYFKKYQGGSISLVK
ncbi:MAG: hypothetical protein RIC15_05900 [Vicingaceae bacterium]